MIQLSISARPVADMDSLELVLKKLPDSSKLVHLKELAYLAKGKNLKMYAGRLLQEAERQGNTDYKGDALFVLVRYYYVYNVDSMRLLIKEAEPLFLEKGRLEDLFRMKAWNIYACTKRGENDDALRETELLNKLAAIRKVKRWQIKRWQTIIIKTSCVKSRWLCAKISSSGWKLVMPL